MVICKTHSIRLSITGEKKTLLMPPMIPNSSVNAKLSMVNHDCYLLHAKAEPQPGEHQNCTIESV